MENTDGKAIAGLEEELQGYVRKGVSIWMDGVSCSPAEAAQGCLLREEACYMRDYVRDDNNRIVQIRFDRVNPIPGDCSCLYNYRKKR